MSLIKIGGVLVGKYHYNFLFKEPFQKLSKPNLDILLSIEDFKLELDRVITEKKIIKDCDIYDIVKRFYFPMLKDFETEGFKTYYKQTYGYMAYKDWSRKFRIFGCATKRFSRDLYDTALWKEEFLNYKNEVII